ncbi:hypothetical protein MKLM6_3606 [Methylomonas koyamae]|nr:hypothetical protein MKLM6_3606 [Methylomonas koyamae]
MCADSINNESTENKQKPRFQLTKPKTSSRHFVTFSTHLGLYFATSSFNR